MKKPRKDIVLPPINAKPEDVADALFRSKEKSSDKPVESQKDDEKPN